MPTTLTVRLADVPADVLVYLGEHTSSEAGLTRRQLADALAPERPHLDEVDVERLVLRGLHLLHQLGFVHSVGAVGPSAPMIRWAATASGRAAIDAWRAGQEAQQHVG